MKLGKIALFLFLVCNTQGALYAQINLEHLHSRVLGPAQEPLEFANLSLRSSDSTQLHVVMTDSIGRFILPLHPRAQWLVVKSFGYKTQWIDFKNFQEQATDIILEQSLSKLKKVTINAKRPLISREGNKIVFNVGNGALSAAQSAYELLQRAPGVLVNDDAILLNGKAGISILINTRAQNIDNAQLINTLKSIPASQVSRIEISSSPTAEYDAQGTGGIIDIKLKKMMQNGTNASLLTSIGRSQYHRSGLNISFNRRKGKQNIYGNLNNGYNERSNRLISNRNFMQNEKLLARYEQDGIIFLPILRNSLRLGYDYYVNEKTTIGLLIAGGASHFKPRGDGDALIFDENRIQTGGFIATNRSKDVWSRRSANANVQHQINKKGAQFNADINYAKYGNRTEQLFTTDFFNANKQLQNREILFGDIRGHIDVYSVQVDLTLPIFNKSKIKTGVKSSLVKNDNDLKYFIRQNGIDSFDASQSNHFLYDENINAAYIDWEKSNKKTVYKLGLRAEHTYSKGLQLSTDTGFTRDYIQLFPNIYTLYKLNDKKSVSLQLSRRINRPSYRALNPFRAFVDKTTYREGSPYLTPEITNNIEFVYAHDRTHYITLNYMHTDNSILNIVIQDNEQKVSIDKPVNIGQYVYYGITLSGVEKIWKFWTLQWSASTFYNEFLGNIEQIPLNTSGGGFQISTNHQFSLSKKTRCELGTYYQPRYAYGVSILHSMWKVDAGISKRILNDKGSIKFSAQDIFWKFYPTGYTDFGNTQQTFQSIRDTRVFMLSFQYNFGDLGIKSQRRRTLGIEDIKQRAS